MTSHPAQVRTERNKRIAVRAALAGARLDPTQLKLVIKEHDALSAKSDALFKEHTKVFDATPRAPTQDEASDRVYSVAIRRLDQLEKQREAYVARAAKLRAHPQISAAIYERYKKEERGR